MNKFIEKIEETTLPLIPMRGLVVFPEFPVSFEIKRKKSVLAMLEANGGEVFLCAQKEITVENPGENDLYTHGVIAEIKQSMRLPDDGYRIIVEASKRAEIKHFDNTEPFFRCTVFARDTFSVGRRRSKG